MEVLLRPLFSIPSRTLTPPPPSPPHQSSHSQNSPFLPPLIPTLSKTLLSSSLVSSRLPLLDKQHRRANRARR
ncbi:hypothetical protein CUMW_119110 [Citrus unshiu]|nr:hypothetical protein CUMW_119110 [Citrus unshiu]